MIMTFGVVLVGCDRNSSPHRESAPSDMYDPKVSQLTDTVGNPDNLMASAKLPRERALAAAKEYKPPTGKWFDGENGFNLLTSISSEDAQAGSTVGAALGKIPEGRSVRFQLTRRDKDGGRLERITEYVGDIKNTVNGRLDFSTDIPEHPNTNYLLSIEILSSGGTTEDTLLSPLFVPPDELNARLIVQQPKEGADKTELTLYNAGPSDLYFGYGYQIYHKVANGWQQVPDNNPVPSIGIRTKPGFSHKETVYFPRTLEPGYYRIVKHFEGYMTDVSVSLAADFKV